MENFKITTDLIKFVEDHRQTLDYILEIRRVELNSVQDKAKQAYYTIRRISRETHESTENFDQSRIRKCM